MRLAPFLALSLLVTGTSVFAEEGQKKPLPLPDKEPLSLRLQMAVGLVKKVLNTTPSVGGSTTTITEYLWRTGGKARIDRHESAEEITATSTGWRRDGTVSARYRGSATATERHTNATFLRRDGTPKAVLTTDTQREVGRSGRTLSATTKVESRRLGRDGGVRSRGGYEVQAGDGLKVKVFHEGRHLNFSKTFGR